MSSTILDLIEKSAFLYPQNIAIGDAVSNVTYSELMIKIKQIATGIIETGISRKSIAILMKRGRNVPSVMLGVAFSGNFYVVLDSDSPTERLIKIINTLNPSTIIYENDTKELYSNLNVNIEGLEYENISNTKYNDIAFNKVKNEILDTDPIYSIFTSGSTGFPKGALLTHRNVASYIEWLTQCFKITKDTVFGSQTPLYFSMSVSDMFSALVTGGSYQMIPKEYFTFPIKLIDFMNTRKVNTIYWVPSAYGIIAKMDLLKYAMPKYLHKLLFAGEVMPIRYLNYWKGYYPDALFANLFGPTETTDICSYYKVDREFTEDETLPIGFPCENCRLFIIDENGKEVTNSDIGELYVLGEGVASGYYNNELKTKEVFVQNPLNPSFPQTVYKTGDIVRKNSFGELEYIGRKDFQIKHMGYRIELGEVETAFNSIHDISIAICIYDEESDKLILVYESKKDFNDLLQENANLKLPVYMRPDEYIRLDSLPINSNGKIDRKQIKNIIITK